MRSLLLSRLSAIDACVSAVKTRPKQMHLQTIRMDDVGIYFREHAFQSRRIPDRRHGGGADLSSQTHACRRCPPASPLTEPGKRPRKFQRSGRDFQFGRAREERPFGGRDEVERPLGTYGAKGNEKIEEGCFGAPELAARVEKRNPHKRRGRTFT